MAPQHRRYNLYEETMAPMNRIAIDMVGSQEDEERKYTHLFDVLPILPLA